MAGNGAKRKVTVEKLKEIQENLYDGLGMKAACTKADIAYATYNKARHEVRRGRGDVRIRNRLLAHFAKHEDIRADMAQELKAEAPFILLAMGVRLEDWRAIAKAAELVKLPEAQQETLVQETCQKLLAELAVATAPAADASDAQS